MGHSELVVIGASAGGLAGLPHIVTQLPAAVAVVVHNNGRTQLPAILARVSELPVVVPENRDAIVPRVSRRCGSGLLTSSRDQLFGRTPPAEAPAPLSERAGAPVKTRRANGKSRSRRSV